MTGASNHARKAGKQEERRKGTVLQKAGFVGLSSTVAGRAFLLEWLDIQT